jgi:hypothetical protein
LIENFVDKKLKKIQEQRRDTFQIEYDDDNKN